MQDMDTLTAAFSDETSVYKSPPEVQISEVVIAKQEEVSQFLRVARQSLYDLKCPGKKYIFQPHEKCQILQWLVIINIVTDLPHKI